MPYWQELPARLPGSFEQTLTRTPLFRPGRGQSQVPHWTWLCPGCDRPAATLFLPIGAPDFALGHDIPLPPAQTAPEPHLAFACKHCHRVSRLSRTPKSLSWTWSRLVTHLSSGLLLGHEVPRPAAFGALRENKPPKPRPSPRLDQMERYLVETDLSLREIARELRCTYVAVALASSRICRKRGVQGHRAGLKRWHRQHAMLKPPGIRGIDWPQSRARSPRRPARAAVQETSLNVETMTGDSVSLGPRHARAATAALYFTRYCATATLIRMSSPLRPPPAAFDWELARMDYREHLPHVVQGNAIYYVTFRLHDSVPLAKLRQWRSELARWERSNPPPRAPQQQEQFAELGYRRIERWLDRHTGSCILEDPRCQDVIEQCFTRCDGERFWLGDYIIMPNHVHALLQVAQGEKLKTILKAWYAVTTRGVNRIIRQSGRLWQEEPFDHIVRNESSLQRIRKYIQDNGNGLDPRRWRYGCGKLFEQESQVTAATGACRSREEAPE